jgi:hypothetical protein
VLNILTMKCLGVVFLILSAGTVPEWLSLNIGKFSPIILLNIFYIPLACPSSPSPMAMICRLSLLIVPQVFACCIHASLFFFL